MTTWEEMKQRLDAINNAPLIERLTRWASNLIDRVARNGPYMYVDGEIAHGVSRGVYSLDECLEMYSPGVYDTWGCMLTAIIRDELHWAMNGQGLSEHMLESSYPQQWPEYYLAWRMRIMMATTASAPRHEEKIAWHIEGF